VQKLRVRRDDICGEEARFIVLPITKIDSISRFEKGSYVAVEGVLQLKQPLSKPESVGGA
jgi:hypothetical protein